ncbi:MAG: histidine kinase dimerization/phospho-acceptor domain-containing protein, partial [Kiritimatiellia bacterium]
MDDPLRLSPGSAPRLKSFRLRAAGTLLLAALSLLTAWLLSHLSDPFSHQNLFRALLIFPLLWLLDRYRKHLKNLGLKDQEELLLEVQEMKLDSVDRKIRLPLNSPFKPVADFINQQIAVRERQARQLTEQHHHQQVLLNNMSEGILALDNDQRITGINPAAARWLELGNPVRAQGEVFYTRYRNPKLLQIIEELTTSQTSFKETYLRLERTGMEDRILRVKGSPLIDHDQTIGVLLLLQDVTTLHRLETLRQDFVANVSHELRTPLTAIKGYAELLLDEPDNPEEVRNYTERIVKQSTRMINILEDLLSLTRIESADAQAALSLTELKPLLEKVIELCEDQATMRDLKVELECGENLRAELQAPLFEQAVHNLVYNAVKYTYPSTRILIRAREEKQEIRLEVIDKGPGIPE